MRVSVTIGSAPAGEVPEKDQDDRQELQAHAPPHQLVAAPSAFYVAVDVAAHADQTSEQHAERGQAGDNHQDEQDVGEHHTLLYAVLSLIMPARATARASPRSRTPRRRDAGGR